MVRGRWWTERFDTTVIGVSAGEATGGTVLDASGHEGSGPAVPEEDPDS